MEQMDIIKLGTKTVWIFRGPPGSGKTSAAKRLEKVFAPRVAYISMDDYRTDEDGNYKFDPSKVPAEVKRMKDSFVEVLKAGIEDVILDNVHSRAWEYEWAMRVAADFNYVVHVLEVQADLLKCWERQTHPVPWDKFVDIFKRWETPVKLPDLMDLLRIVVDLGLR